MSSDAGPVTSPPPASHEPSATATNGASDSAQATSEGNVASTDPPPSTDVADQKEADANVDGKAVDTTEGAVSGAVSGATPASTKKGKNDKRRSSGIPEHKSKKKGGKKEVVLNLDAEPGDFYLAIVKGHQPWPSIIADEDMLSEVMMATRPVSTRRTDGSYRDDFNEGGKNAKDRTYPVMFLGTNEFAWVKNTDLSKLLPEDLQDLDNKKLSKKGLLEAYKIAAEKKPLDEFKKILIDFENARRAEELAWYEEQKKQEAKSAKKQEREEKAAAKGTKAKRKSSAGIGDREEELMEDSSEAPKSNKKRKKDAVESDAEDKPAAKTPKIKLNASKATNADSAAKPKKAKSTPKSAAKAKETTNAPPAMTEQQIQEKKHQSVLYLRHKLQKGFLQNTAPEASAMPEMANHFSTLEQYKELEVPIIRNTKIHKVLKAILKLDSVPEEEKFKFKERSNVLLEGWLAALAVDDSNNAAPVPATTNGTTDTKTEEAKVEEAPKLEEAAKTEDTEMKDAPAVTEPPAAPVEVGTLGNDAKDEATDGDVSMEDAVKVEKSDVPSAAEAAASEPAATVEAAEAASEAVAS